MKFTSVLLILAVFAFGSCSEKPEPVTGELPLYLTPDVMCGTVQFSDGCGESTDSLIRFGLALIHHMTYDDAEQVFKQVIDKDPDCFWGHWGQAMTYIHPLWPDEPTEDQLRKGWVLAQRALSLAQKEKEKLYGTALAAYYENGVNKTEKERLVALQNGWKNAGEKTPGDLEVRLFHALIKLANVSPDDKSYAVQLEVGATAEGVLEIIPDHPGGFHYAIHAYDIPSLAHKAVRVARNYSNIAPEIPHALHMPTHIFTRLGHWQESIDWNARSAKAAWKMPVNGQISLHYLHALDYMVYAHLQQAEDGKAREILKGIDTLSGPVQVNPASAYALAAIPGRIAIENQDWAAATKIQVPPFDIPWEKFAHLEALVHFAKGIGAGRSGNAALAQQAFEKLDSLHASLGDKPATQYWAQQINIQKTAVKSWHAFAKGDKTLAVQTMKEAAGMEDATEKNPITPGELVPIRELLGDMLLEMNEPAEALANYERSLQRSPNRFNTVYGAGKAAKLAGDNAKAKSYFNQLLELRGKAASDRQQLVEASKAVKEI